MNRAVGEYNYNERQSWLRAYAQICNKPCMQKNRMESKFHAMEATNGRHTVSFAGKTLKFRAPQSRNEFLFTPC